MKASVSRPVYVDKRDALQKQQKEADEMEVRLRKLRGQMDEERAIRQSKLESLSGGRMWQSSGSKLTGNLRHEISGRGNTTMPSGAPARVIASLLAARESNSPGSPKSHPRSPRQAPNSPADGPGRIRTSSSMPSGSPARVIASLIAERASLTAAAQSASLEAEDQAPTEHSPAPARRDAVPADPAEPSASSLLQGTFDESESSASFRAAIAEWRGEAPVPAAAEPQHVSMACGDPAPQPPGSAGPAPEAPLTFFERLQLRRRAAAAGAEAAALTPCDAPGPATRPATASAPTAAGSEELRSVTTACDLDDEDPPAVVAPHAWDVDSDHRGSFGGETRDAVHDPECEELDLLSITNAHPTETLTSRCRLPDQVLLPE